MTTNRVIKFRAWDSLAEQMFGVGYSPQEFWSYVHPASCDVDVMQFTGLHDKNGKEIYEGDLLNVYYTSGNGEHIHDCIYEAIIGCMGDFQLVFRGLLFECQGHNQYPVSTNLCLEYKTLGTKHEEGNRILIVRDTWGENHLHRTEWKENDESDYFEVIGNIYETPELLGKQQ